MTGAWRRRVGALLAVGVLVAVALVFSLHRAAAPAARAAAGPCANRTAVTVFSMDHHTALVADTRWLWTRHVADALCLDFTFLDYSQAEYCAHADPPTCKSLPGVTPQSLYQLAPMPHAYRRNFFAQNRALMERVDVFLCTLPPATCQLYMPFNRTMVVIVPVLPINGRSGQPYEREWFEDLDLMLHRARGPPNFLVSNSRAFAHPVDAAFPRLVPQYIPSMCAYTGLAWRGRGARRAYMLGKRGQPSAADAGAWAQLRAVRAALADAGFEVDCASEARFVSHEDVAAYALVVLVPWGPSVMSGFELYAMNVPLFMPSWAFFRAYWPHAANAHAAHEYEHTAWRGVQTFDSGAHFAALLRDGDVDARLDAMHARAREDNAARLAEIARAWTGVFARIAPAVGSGGAVGDDFDAAMGAAYGVDAATRYTTSPAGWPSTSELALRAPGKWTARDLSPACAV